MDGVIGRFLTEEDDGFDPCYDTLLNSPMSDGEIFQFLYAQLALRALFDCTILDMMLNGQLRGDNLGFAYLPPARLAEPPTSAPRKGILVVFQSQEDTEPRFLCFPEKKTGSGESRDESVRLISFIDLGQGKQPGLQELTKRGLIGETIVESCIQDDGFGRYWPLDRLYCKDIETCGTVARQAIHWGTNVCVDSPQASEAALKELFDLYAPVYGVDPPTEEGLHDYVVFRWVPEVVRKIRG
ncbi:unnamed protein product [Trypanosoma congolense IL3000]|uniref:WGS project CAEQ00000000 data, annotated contig 1042 n=1 Tax=Trypanosoma congolense (strain IL3000) TaxID=1068625 RepID=F9W3E6_TRYCI|nr:unnamed protein product [Trypanosoma congolense IL3000]